LEEAKKLIIPSFAFPEYESHVSTQIKYCPFTIYFLLGPVKAKFQPKFNIVNSQKKKSLGTRYGRCGWFRTCRFQRRTSAHYILSGAVLAIWDQIEKVLAEHGRQKRHQVVRFRTERVIGEIFQQSLHLS
jgi:hypothetical protein